MRRTISLFITILFFSAFTFSQKQYRTEVINGVEYYIYSVKQGEGLYRISVNFGVSQEEISRINPEVKNGLKAGQFLFIPKKAGVTPQNTTASSQERITAQTQETTSSAATTTPAQTPQKETSQATQSTQNQVAQTKETTSSQTTTPVQPTQKEISQSTQNKSAKNKGAKTKETISSTETTPPAQTPQKETNQTAQNKAVQNQETTSPQTTTPVQPIQKQPSQPAQPTQAQQTQNTASQTQANQQKTAPSVNIIAATLGGKTDKAPAREQQKEEKPETLHKIELKNTEPHFYYHKVEKKQTLYSLSKQYEVSQNDIIKYNPQAATGLREGEVLRIPKPEDIYVEKKAEKMEEDLSVKYMLHTVEAGETLYAISRKYNVEQNDIRKLNPGLEILSIGQELKIPYYTALLTTATIDGKTTTYLDWDKVIEKEEDTVESSKLRIAFLLPFMLNSRNNINITRFIDFYGGAIKAISEAKAKGISIDVYTFDTERSEEKMQEIFSKNPILKEMDLIIGPAYSVQVPVVTNFAKRNKVKTLIPFTSKVADIETNPYVFQFNPGMDAELAFLKELFQNRLNNMNYIFADIEYVPSTDEGAIISKNIKKILDEQGKRYETVVISVPETTNFESIVDKRKKSLFIFNTDQFQVVQPYLEGLNLADRSNEIMLLERYNWKTQDAYRPIGVYVAPFRQESGIKNLNNYNKDFMDLLAWEPITFSPRYDLLGYDLASYFIDILNNKEKNIMNELELEIYWEGMQSQFNFKRKSHSSGFINQQLYLGDSQVQ